MSGSRQQWRVATGVRWFDHDPLGSRTNFHRAVACPSSHAVRVVAALFIPVVAVLSIVFAIGQIVYVLATAGELGWSLGGSRPLITSPCLFLVLTRSASNHVEKYDNARHQGPNSK